jgi:hypothetical protein
MGPGPVARRDLERYYACVTDALRRLALNKAEAFLVMDALNGVFFADDTWRFVWAEVADHIRLNDAATHFGVADPDGLVRRLRDGGLIAAAALTDAAERFWRFPERDAAAFLVELGVLRARLEAAD